MDTKPEQFRDEVWGVVLDDEGSMDFYDTLAEAEDWSNGAEVVHVVTYTVRASRLDPVGT
jgi:hypothetical protein